jgi:hypothetical protein
VHDDVASCEPYGTGIPDNVVRAVAATGTFTVQGSVVDIDIELEFPSGGSLPESVHFEATNCETRCAMEDCRF